MNRLWTWIATLVVFVALGALGTGILALEKPVGSVEGVVASSDGTPLRKAKVTAFGPARRMITTDDKGHFRFDRLPVGTYDLAASTRGFERQWHSPKITIAEGQVVQSATFRLSPVQPALYFSQYQRVFVPDEPLRISYRGTLIDTLHVRLHRADLASITDRTVSIKGRPLGEKLAEWDQKVVDSESSDDDWFYRQIDVKKQPPGLYRLVMSGSGTIHGKTQITPETSLWFNVTRLGLVTKRAAGSTLVYATDLATKQPIADVAIRTGTTMASLERAGRTDQDGLLRHQTGDRAVTVVGEIGDSLAFVQLYEASATDPLVGYVYTDRPIYRPDQTVHVKAVLRDKADQTLRVPRGERVTLTVSDSQGNEAYKSALTTSSLGSVDADVALPATAPLGEYTADVTWGKHSVTSTFQVQAYRKPEFRLEIKPGQQQLLKGQPLKATVAATYYFGAPVAGKKMQYTVYKTPFSTWSSDENWFYSGFEGGDDDHYWGYGDVVTSGEGVTDEAGHLILDVPTAGPEQRQPGEATSEERYTIEVQATDETRRTVTTREAVIVTPSELRLQAEPTQYLYTPGQTMTIGLKARSLGNDPASATLKTTLFREIPPKRNAEGELEGEGTLEAVGNETLTIDRTGIGVLRLKAPAEGSYRLEVSGTDASGRESVALAHLWVANDDYGGGSSYHYGALQIVFDKATYRLGDTATVFVARPTPDVPVLLTVEGQRIYEANVLRGNGASATFKIPVNATFSPNAFIAATVVDGKAFHQAERSLNVLPADRFLNVEVKADRARYKPGETATLTVSTKDAKGNGVPAEVSVGVVDQSIYALAPDTTPDPRKVFHGPLPNAVSTFYSFSEDYSGGANKDGAEPRVRRKFLDTAAWFPSVRTDGRGLARVSFELPDNLTTWIVTARGHTADTKVGATLASFLETQDLLARLATPRFMVETDRLTLVGLIHNYLPDAATVKSALKALGIELTGPAEHEATVAPGGIARQDYDVTATDAGTATLTLTAKSPKAGDALELSFPVLPHGVEDVAVHAGVSTGDTTVEINVPTGAVPAATALTIELTPTPLGAVAGALEYLRQYPYGCIEQTLNRFVPELVAAPLVGGEPRNDNLIAEGIARIRSQQHSDGGWGWWANDASDLNWTAYALLALAEAKQADVAIPEAMSEPAIAFLERQLGRLGKDAVSPHTIRKGAGADQQALLHLALSRWGHGQIAAARQVASLEQLTPQGRAFLAITLWQLGSPDGAREQIAKLAESAVTSADQAHWAGTDDDWYTNDIEATSTVLQAMMRVQPDHALVDPAVRYLLTQRKGSRWQSTKDTAATVIALASYTRQRGSEPESTPVTLRLDGQVVAQADLREPGYWRNGYRTVVQGEQLAPGTHTLIIDRDDEGTRSLPFSLSRATVVRMDKIAAQDGPQLSVTRTYRRLGAADRQEHPDWLISEWFDRKRAAKLSEVGGSVRTGELIIVELTVQTDKPRSFIMLQDPLAAGMEVATDRGAEDSWNYWWSQREVHDDHVAFFVSRLPKGQHSLYYVIRPEIPGVVHALPPSVAEMYAPDVRARGDEAVFTVRP